MSETTTIEKKEELTVQQKGNALTVIQHLSVALAFGDSVAYQLGAHHIAAAERDHLIAAVEEIDGISNRTATQVIDAALHVLGRSTS